MAERVSKYPLIDNDTIKVNNEGKIYAATTANNITDNDVDNDTIKINDTNKLYVVPSALIDDTTLHTNSSNKIYVDYTASNTFANKNANTTINAANYLTVSTNYGNVCLYSSSSTERIGLYDDKHSEWLLTRCQASDSWSSTMGETIMVNGNGQAQRLGFSTGHQFFFRPVSAIDDTMNDYFWVQANGSVTMCDTTSTNCLFRCGRDSTSRFMASYVAYSRTTTSAANINVSSTGVFRRYSSSSVKYKHDVNYLSNIDYASEAGLAAQPEVKTLDNIPGIEEDGEVHVREAEVAEKDMDSILNFPVVQFHFNEDYILDDDNNNEWETGFIAEDIYEICPECVDLDSITGEPETWNINKVVPRMVYVIQQQEETIKALTERIEKLETSNA